MSLGYGAPASSLIDSEVVRVAEESPGYLRVVFDNPPLNYFDPEVFAGLGLLQRYVEDKAGDVRVLVFESANPDFFFAHVDFPRIAEVSEAPGGRSLIENWPRFSTWLSSAPVVSVSKVRGRARGIGNEFVLANDLRFASREKASFCQIEVGFGMVPGGGGLEWLPRHVGRARALEIILSADDVDAPTAELYGLVNRALPDAELDEYVDRLARRIAGFPSQSIATTKALVGSRQDLPTEEDLRESFAAILRLAGTDESKAISARVRRKAGGTLAPAELDLPKWYGPEQR
ncbi:enoyl-CoA hydratase/isomerase family protein [Actinomadura sp. SCN-SB]|uniref:enoyl-CoA hydratase/isomerase family protein n=1 Tax=Actinomadura sp. SCN-SB TaxID=3373092 RepID=UPI003750F1B8